MKVRSTEARRGAAVAAVALAVAMTGTACAGQDPATAAVVNGQVIAESDLEAVTRDVAAMRTTGQEVSKQDILITLLLRPFVVEAAQRSGSMVSTSEARALLANTVPNPSPQTLDFAQTSLISRKLPQQELARVVQQFRSASITVNPRYGTVDPGRGIVPAAQNWMDPSVATGSQN